jgi:hypothetical protein
MHALQNAALHSFVSLHQQPSLLSAFQLTGKDRSMPVALHDAFARHIGEPFT